MNADPHLTRGYISYTYLMKKNRELNSPSSLLKGMELLLAVFVVLTASFNSAAGAQSPSPSDNFCYQYSVNKLIPCTDYLTPGNNGGKPAVNGECCRGLKDLFNDEPQCLCFLIDPNNGLPPFIDRQKALFLPAPCNATVPPLIQCLAAGSPDGAPEEPPLSMAAAGTSATALLAGTSFAIVAAFL